MKGPRSRILAPLAISLLVAALFQLASLLGSGRENRQRSPTNEGKESPPEDWFITQRVTHGGIPAGALEKAGAQAAALAFATGRSDPQLAAARWKFVGPTNIGGRVVDIAVDPVAADTIYVAAATGGIWKSTDRGVTFTSIWPVANPQSMGALVITSIGTLFAGTGEANPGGGSITYGGAGVYRSTDGGTSWQRLTNGLPASSSTIGRIGVALAASNPQRLYAIVIQTNGLFQGFYRSDNGGDSWTKLPTSSTLSGAQSTYGWWFGRVWVDPLDQAHVFGAGVYLCESKNSGSSLTVEFTPHADDHAIAWDLKLPSRVYLAN